MLAFIYPQTGIDYRLGGGREHNHIPYLASVDEIEALTGLDFFSNVDDGVEAVIERIVQTTLWD